MAQFLLAFLAEAFPPVSFHISEVQSFLNKTIKLTIMAF